MAAETAGRRSFHNFYLHHLGAADVERHRGHRCPSLPRKAGVQLAQTDSGDLVGEHDSLRLDADQHGAKAAPLHFIGMLPAKEHQPGAVAAQQAVKNFYGLEVPLGQGLPDQTFKKLDVTLGRRKSLGDDAAPTTIGVATNQNFGASTHLLEERSLVAGGEGGDSQLVHDRQTKATWLRGVRGDAGRRHCQVTILRGK